jgi:hypothetical protein
LPLEPEYHNGNPVAVEGKTSPDRIPPNRTLKIISPGLFAALGTRLIVGWDFIWNDLLTQHRVAIVSENMAHENWGDPRNALGKRIRISGTAQWSVVVAVAETSTTTGLIGSLRESSISPRLAAVSHSQYEAGVSPQKAFSRKSQRASMP